MFLPLTYLYKMKCQSNLWHLFMEPDDLTDDQQKKNTVQLVIKTDCKLSYYRITLLYTVKKYLCQGTFDCFVCLLFIKELTKQ